MFMTNNNLHTFEQLEEFATQYIGEITKRSNYNCTPRRISIATCTDHHLRSTCKCQMHF